MFLLHTFKPNIEQETHFHARCYNNVLFCFFSIQFLRHLRDFFQVMFKIDAAPKNETEDLRTGGDKLILTCVGVGFRNLNKLIM